MTEAHLTHLAVTMRRLEEGLVEIERELGESRQEQIMVFYQHDMPASLAPAVVRHIERLRDELRQVKERYLLAPEIISDRRRFGAKLSLLSIDLEGANSRSMTGYGALAEEELRLLDDQVNKMIDLVRSLHELIARLSVVPDPQQNLHRGNRDPK